MVCISIPTIQFINLDIWASAAIKHISFANTVNQFKHYSYLGINLSVGLLLAAFLLKNKKPLLQLALITILSITYILFIYLSQARMALFTVLIASTLALLNIIILYRNKILTATLFLSIFVGIIFVLLRNPRLPLAQDIENITLEDIDANRNLIWTESLIMIKQHPIFGNGIGDTKIVIENGLSYNSHNQILEFFLEGGIISNILFWSFGFIVLFRRFSGKYRFYSIGIFSLYYIALLSESLLNRIAGVSLFVFIYYLFEKTIDIDLKPSISKKLNLMLGLLLASILTLLIVVTISIFRKESFNSKNPKTFIEQPVKLVTYKALPEEKPDAIRWGTKGVLLDSSTYAESWSGNAYSYTQIANPNLKAIDSLEASVYCYVSNDFNGTWVRISSEGSSYENTSSFYDLGKKDSWQKLKINPKCNAGDVPIYLYISKYNCTNFDCLQGYVIFAYPEIFINGEPFK